MVSVTGKLLEWHMQKFITNENDKIMPSKDLKHFWFTKRFQVNVYDLMVSTQTFWLKHLLNIYKITQETEV